MNNKTIITLALLLFMTTARMSAQVFILSDEEFKYAKRGLSCSDLPIIPTLDITYDQYAPIGDGAMLLALLSGAYLLGKRRKKE